MTAQVGKAAREDRAAAAQTTAPASVPTRYTSPEVVQASTRLHEVWSPGQPMPRRPVAALRTLPTVVSCIRRLPVTPVPVSSTPAGKTIQRRLRQRRWGLPVNRLAQGVLVLPEEFESYGRGRRMCGMRNNIKRARATMECHELRPGKHLDVIKPVLRNHNDTRRPYDVRLKWWDDQFGMPGTRAWYVQTKAGEPVALALVTVDATTAYLQEMVSIDRQARWLLHAKLVEDLHAVGVRLLLTYSTNALLLEPNLQKFQHMLGYTVTNVKEVRGAEAETPQRNARPDLDTDPELMVSGYAA